MHKPSPSSAAEVLGTIRAEIDAELASLFHAGLDGELLVETAIREALAGPAKRLRPILVVLAAEDLGFQSPLNAKAGCAVELVHTASLLLDDLPCMDDAVERRGKAATHIRFGEDVAILAAIALLSEAFLQVSLLPGITGEQARAMTASLGRAIGTSGLVAGQFADLKGSMSPTRNVTRVNDQKTGALFVASLELAATLAHASAAERAALQAYATELGRAFQLFDDLLDVAGDPAKMGKPKHQDRNKPVLAQTLGQEAMLARVLQHVSAARIALASLPREAPRLTGFTDYLFGPLDPVPIAHRVPEAILPRLLAR